MFKHWVLSALLFCVVLFSSTAGAQNLCPPGVVSDKLICLIPQVYGPNGLIIPGGNAAFQNGFLGSSLKPLNSAIARQAVLFPIPSPSSGITFEWDETTKVFSRSTDSYGPIYAERAETIGQHKVFLAFNYEYVKFNSLDGVGLKSLPEVFTQPDDTVHAPGFTCSASVNGFNTNQCAFIRDVVKVNNRVDLKIHQFVTFITFGLTNRIDISLAIPIANIRMGISSDATIVDVSATGVHEFTGCVTSAPCLNHQFSNVRTATGIGDMTLRVKGTAVKGERAALALGADVRVPTGDALNFLGAGAPGVRPFVVGSYRARASPHFVIGYEANGSSSIAGDITTGSKERLPGQLTYAGGADVWLNKRLTLAFDLVGQQVFQAQRLSPTTFTELGACIRNVTDPLNPLCPRGPGPNNVGNKDPNLTQTTGTFNVSNVSIGSKLQPLSNLLITGNVLIKMNSGGLRSNFVPLLAISYTF